VIPLLNAWIETAQERCVMVYASRDWHPPHHLSFEGQGGPWPPHCVQDTPGAAFHPELRLPDEAFRIAKGTRLDRDQYSAFDATGLAEHLRARDVRRVWVGGLALDVCVEATVLDALEAGFEAHLLRAATRPVDADAGEAAVRRMEEAGAVVETRAKPSEA
jgi:nicotinamidase/pyrazinamidase